MLSLALLVVKNSYDTNKEKTADAGMPLWTMEEIVITE
jgi:hypothetical protein